MKIALTTLAGGLATLGVIALFAGTGAWLGTPWDGLIGIGAAWIAIAAAVTA